MTQASRPSTQEYVPFRTFESFYVFYLGEHSTKACKILHFVGTGLILLVLIGIVITREWNRLWLLPVCGYSFAWIGHFVFEKNRPASFKQPLYSLRGDFVMFFQLLTGKFSFATNAPHPSIRAHKSIS